MCIWCVIDRRWLVQESAGLIPNWLCDIKLFLVKNLNLAVIQKNFFFQPNILAETDSKEIGRWFLNSSLLFFLMLGTTLVFFDSEENFPLSIKDLVVMPSGFEIDSSQLFIIQILILSWPWALFGLRFLIIFKRSYVKTDESDLLVFSVRTERSLLLLLTIL